MNEARQLLLLRHADAETPANLEDFDRPLSQKGHRQAAYLASHLKAIPIDYVLCSSSVRTRETAIPILHTRCNSMPTVVYDRHVYGAGAKGLLESISNLPPTAKTVLLVGHNPAMEDLLEILQAHDPAGRVVRTVEKDRLGRRILLEKTAHLVDVRTKVS